MTSVTRVLVTGGAGFIGSHVAEAYLAAGYEVTVIDDLSSGKKRNVPDGAELVICDICSEEARAIVASGKFSVLNHHAAQMDVRVSVSDPQLDARTNLIGLLNLLEGARHGGIEKVVFASSGGVVYGESGSPPYKEDANKVPLSPYGVSKLASEYYMSVYSHMYDVSAVSLRYTNVYGPRQNPHGEAGVVAIFGERIGRGGPITIFGDGKQTRDYIFVEDVAAANVAAAEWSAVGAETIDDAAFNIGTGIETSVNELAAIMVEIAGVDVTIQRAPARTGELQRNAVANDRAARELSWSPRVKLEVGIQQTYSWVMEAAP